MKRILITIIMALGILDTIQAQQVIDTHAHMITSTYRDFLAKHNALLDEDFPIPAWNLEQHLEFMNEAGITTSVLTLPAPQPFFGDANESAQLIRKVNEEMAEVKAQHPDRFLFCAALPLPDVEAAVREAIYALDTLHADGVKIATNSRGLYLGDPALEPLMQVLNEREAVIITHPHKPSAVNAELTSVVPLASYEYLAETTRTILNMVGHNITLRYPRLKIVVPHCGSFLPLAVPRMQALMPVMNGVGYLQDVDIARNLEAFYYDLAGAPIPATVRELLTITTAEHLLYGTDYPYVAPAVLSRNLPILKQTLKEIVPEHVEDILYRNAYYLFSK